MRLRPLAVLLVAISAGCATAPKAGPGVDVDGDGVVDAKDECPDAAEEQGGDGDGCPDAPQIVIESGMINIRGKIIFGVASAELLPKNARLLEALAKVLNENDQIKRIQVEGHTDATGEEGFNQQLSLERAQTVGKALIQRGVKSERLSTKGLGRSQPLASNDTEAGRARNRRVEFRVVE
ncbi:MAG: OmpA/MotB domain protein [Myxococcaceae bacterium]|nr:OmpA/MotB domain protein [Myxococcaceae bacterium]